MRMNYANEGGYDMRYRVLTNIMGLWLIQSIKKECKDLYSFSDLAIMAQENEKNAVAIDINDESFRAPESMLGAIRAYCNSPEMSVGEAVACVYAGLAKSYATNIRNLPALTGKMPSALHIIGGGSQDTYLNQLTAKACGIPVYTGPVEATAIGNILAQMLGTGAFASIEEARQCVFNSFEVKIVE